MVADQVEVLRRHPLRGRWRRHRKPPLITKRLGARGSGSFRMCAAVQSPIASASSGGVALPICFTFSVRPLPSTTQSIGNDWRQNHLLEPQGSVLPSERASGRTGLCRKRPRWCVLGELEQERPIPRSIAEEPLTTSSRCARGSSDLPESKAG